MKKKKNIARIVSIVLVIAMVFTFIISVVPMQTFTNLGKVEETVSTETQQTSPPKETVEPVKEENTTVSLEELKSEKKIAIIKFTTGEAIKLALYPKIAPISVENFVNLANEHFYDGLTFHRVVKDFMIQGGDPTGTGMGGSENTIKGEFLANGVENPLSHKKGIISMARSQANDSASSQFFITVADSEFLDGQYAAFGEVLEGQEVADKFSLIETDENEKPVEEIKIESIIIEE